MSKEKFLVTGLAILFLTFFIPAVVFSESGNKTIFTSPLRGDTIMNRKDFIVSWNIEKFDQSTGHYWVAIATMSCEPDDWRDILELYRESGQQHSVARKKMNKKLQNLKLYQIWPKFEVIEKNGTGHIYECGTNPRMDEPQAMILLLLKVDDRLNQIIRDREIKKDNGGMQLSQFPKNMRLARCEIFFP